MAISMLKIRRPLGRLIFNMGIAIPGKTVFLIETAPCSLLKIEPNPAFYNNEPKHISTICLSYIAYNIQIVIKMAAFIIILTSA